MKINKRNDSKSSKTMYDKQLPPIDSSAPPMPHVNPPKQSKKS